MLRSFRLAVYLLAGGCLVGFPTAFGDEPKGETKPAEAKQVEVESTEESSELVVPADADAETKKLIQRMQKEQAEAAKSLKKHRSAAPFQQSATIRLPAGEGQVLGFCVLPNGNIAAISGSSQAYGDSALSLLGRAVGGTPKASHRRVQWLDDSGKVLHSADLNFAPKAINSAADGTVVVVGDGTLARFDGMGKKLVQVESPHITQAVANREKFDAEVMERHEEEIAQYQEQVNQFTEAFKEIEEKPAADRSQSEKAQLTQTKLIVSQYTTMLKQKKAMKKENIVAQAMSRLKEVHRVAVSDKHVFVVTGEPMGYGFCVWRMTHDFAEPKKIVSNLAGCCGQMDVQVVGEELAIAENSRHRVLFVDYEGKTTRNFGSTNRTDVTKGFGGCCNPMNTCCDSEGYVLTSESNGLVKRYKRDGEFQAVVGVANVTEGCKNSSIGISPDGNSVYYFDVTKGEILVMKKKA